MKQSQQTAARHQLSSFGPEYPEWPDTTKIAFLERRLVLFKKQMAHREKIADNQRHLLKALQRERDKLLTQLQQKNSELQLANHELATTRDHLEQKVHMRTKELEEKNVQLEGHAKELEQIYTALDVMVKKNTQDYKTATRDVIVRTQAHIGPIITRLLLSVSNPKQRSMLLEMQSILQNMNQNHPPPSKNRTTVCFNLTSRELEVARHVAEGKTCREVAAILKISPRSVETCCYSIRKKCKLTRKVNLKTFLASLEILNEE